MKKIVGTGIILVIVFCLCAGCFPHYDYTGWKTVEIGDCGTIQIPKEWIVSEKDGLIYITDKELSEEGCSAYFIQSHSYAGTHIGDEDIKESNAFSANLQNMQVTESAVLSNGAVYGKALYSINGTDRELCYLDFSRYHTRVRLVAWSDLISEDTRIKIASSFIPKQESTS
jgi:hypothetical protein